MSALAVAAAALLQMAAAAGSAAGGEQIYREGSSPRGTPLQATIGNGAALAAGLLPCRNCHGADGRGRSEGGLRAADITPAALARPLRDEKRERPPYDASRLRRAITMGFDAAGNTLDPAMPRYALSQADADDLLAYLATLDRRAEVGISDTTIRIGIFGADRLDAPAEAIYGRRIELVRESRDDVLLVIDASADGSASLRAAAADAVPTIVFDAGDAEPGASGLAVTAARTRREQVLRDWAVGAQALVLQTGCAEAGLATAPALALSGEVAASCALQQLPRNPAQPVRLFLAAPPDAALRQAVMRDVLQLMLERLRKLGRDLSREAVLMQLQQIDQARPGGLPPLSWARGRRHGLDAVWVMRLDAARANLVADPGWMELPAR